MKFTYFGFLLLLSSILLGYFAFRRWRESSAHPERTINRYYFIGTALLTLGLFLECIPLLFPVWFSPTAPVWIILATTSNAIAFGYYLRVPFYMKYTERIYSVLDHFISLYILATIGMFIFYPPTPEVFDSTIHWQFNAVQTLLIFLLNMVACGLNIILIYRSVRKSETSWLPKFVLLMIGFIFAASGSGYLYAGNNPILLQVAYTILFLGIFILVIGTLFSPLKLENEKMNVNTNKNSPV